VPEVTVGGHFERVAAVYESLRTTDEAPVREIGQMLPDRPVTGLDVGCGTGRYSRLLRALLPGGSRLAASDVSAAMLAQLTAGAATFRKLADAAVSTDLLLPVRVSDELFFAVICVDDADKARSALGDQVVQEGDRTS
jgi:SAM-dependent methyltransferase